MVLARFFDLFRISYRDHLIASFLQDALANILQMRMTGNYEHGFLVHGQMLLRIPIQQGCGTGITYHKCLLSFDTVHSLRSSPFFVNGYELSLDPGMNDVAAASDLLKPYDARMMRCYPVSTRINHVANDDEEFSAPVELAQIQNRLFS